jgi:hypothetical protein
MNDGPVFYQSKKQNRVARSSCDAEYIGMSEACASMISMIHLLDEMKIESRPMKMLEDNQSSIKLAESKAIGRKSKHIEIHHHFIRDCIKKGEIEVVHCPTNDMIADTFTKSLGKVLFEKHTSKLVS